MTEVPLGAGPLRVIVPVDVAPPAICCGENAKPVGAGGCTVSEVVCWTPWLEAVMVTGVELLTGSVVTVNCAVVLPSGTLTLEGTLTIAGFALLGVTFTPPCRCGSTECDGTLSSGSAYGRRRA